MSQLLGHRSVLGVQSADEILDAVDSLPPGRVSPKARDVLQRKLRCVVCRVYLLASTGNAAIRLLYYSQVIYCDRGCHEVSDSCLCLVMLTVLPRQKPEPTPHRVLSHFWSTPVSKMAAESS